VPAPFRDTRPKIVWDERTSSSAVIVPQAALVTPPALKWQDDPNWSYVGAHPEWFLNVNYDPVAGTGLAYINNGVIGSHDPINGHITRTFTPADFPALAPGLPVRLRGTTFWDYYDTVGPRTVRLKALLNGQPYSNFPSGFPPNPVGTYTFEIEALADGAGELTFEYGIYGDTGIGSVALIGGLGAIQILDASCDEVVTTRRLDFAYPLEEVRSWRQPREGSAHLVYPSGEESAWIRGHDGFLEGEVRWIPRLTTVDPRNDGWEDTDGVKGWQRFLAWARRRGNTFRFHPDADDDALFYECVLVEPQTDPEPEDDMTRALAPFRLRTVDGSLIEGY
jgi:hypothetical protein